MFQLIRSSFGPFQQLQFIHAATGNSFSIIPECGACLIDLQLQGRALLDGYANADELQIHNWYKSEWLFPFPNRLKDGQFQFEGQSYQFPINNPETGNALHGFSAGKNYEIINIDLLETDARLHCRHQYDGGEGAYPFPFQLDLYLKITNQGQFEVDMQLKNTGDQTLPMGLGWHPYFSLGGDVSSWSLQLPPCQQIVIDEYMIPTGALFPYADFDTKKPIGDQVLDTGFVLLEQAPSTTAKVHLSDEQGQMTYWQETGPGKFNYLQVFTPPSRKALAIEPMTCNIDALNNRDGLLLVPAGAEIGGRFGCIYHPLSEQG